MTLLSRILSAVVLLHVALWVQAAPVMVDTAWVAERLGKPDVVLVDMAADGTQYQRFHLPGAVYLPYQALVQRRKNGVVVRIDDARLYKLLGILGIAANSHVVVYDDVGGLQAGRLFWELERIGHGRVSVMDGGLVRWILEGRKVEATAVKPRPATYLPANDKMRANEVLLDEFRQAGDAVFLDVRTRDEYAGDPRGKKPSGHVPGALWWPWQRTVDFSNGFRLRPVESLQQGLARLGIKDKRQPLITYCQTGHRAAQAYLVLRRLGYTRVRLYDGSMAEYLQSGSRPLRKGLRP
jgi:thiosulfate/3-mercaptopyruvate sulfurtransferase